MSGLQEDTIGHHSKFRKNVFYNNDRCFIICRNCCWMASTYSTTNFFSYENQPKTCPICSNDLYNFELDRTVLGQYEKFMNALRTDGHNSKSPKLKVVLIEIILLHSIQGFGRSRSDISKLRRDMKSAVHHYSSLKSQNLKKYLFYLIEYDLIIYDGVNHLFSIKERGLIFISIIINSRKKHSLNFRNLMIAFK